jgi:hypothetical protein
MPLYANDVILFLSPVVQDLPTSIGIFNFFRELIGLA